MKKLEVKDLKENFFEAIGKEWMLVCLLYTSDAADE